MKGVRCEVNGEWWEGEARSLKGSRRRGAQNRQGQKLRARSYEANGKTIIQQSAACRRTLEGRWSVLESLPSWPELRPGWKRLFLPAP